MSDARKGTLTSLLAHRENADPWARASLDHLVQAGRVDTSDCTILSRETVLTVYAVRRDISADTNPEMSQRIGEMLERVAARDLESVVLHAISLEESDLEIWVFTDRSTEQLLGVVPVPRRQD